MILQSIGRHVFIILINQVYREIHSCICMHPPLYPCNMTFCASCCITTQFEDLMFHRWTSFHQHFVVTLGESNAFSMSVSFAFSRRGWHEDTFATQIPKKHSTFTWNHYQSGSEMRFSRHIFITCSFQFFSCCHVTVTIFLQAQFHHDRLYIYVNIHSQTNHIHTYMLTGCTFCFNIKSVMSEVTVQGIGDKVASVISF